MATEKHLPVTPADIRLRRVIGCAVAACRQAQILASARLVASGENVHLSHARAALARCCTVHAVRTGCSEDFFARWFLDGDLPFEALLRAGLDIADSIRTTVRERGTVEKVTVQADSLLRSMVRLARDWASAEGLAPAVIDERLDSEAFYSGGA